MPNCFQLVSRVDGEPAKLVAVDNAMAAAFGEVPDPVVWFRNWYNCLGLSFATGKSIEETKELFPDDADLLDWIDEHYTVDAWAEQKFRD